MTAAGHAERNRRYAGTEKGRAATRDRQRRYRDRRRRQELALRQALGRLRAALSCPGCTCLRIYERPCGACWRRILETAKG